ncbi:hypothetical protein JP0533_12390 [Helicobacter pylori]
MSISRRSILTKIPIVLASANVLKAVGVFEKVESIPHLAAKKLKEIPKENIYNASYGG